jgi:hypothetical protein
MHTSFLRYLKNNILIQAWRTKYVENGGLCRHFIRYEKKPSISQILYESEITMPVFVSFSWISSQQIVLQRRSMQI